MKKTPPSRYGTHRASFNANKKRIMATQTHCGICGNPVDFSLKYPNKLCATVDHIIPINKGGHKSDIDNLQLAHFICNRLKSDKLAEQKKAKTIKKELPLSKDWSNF